MRRLDHRVVRLERTHGIGTGKMYVIEPGEDEDTEAALAALGIIPGPADTVVVTWRRSDDAAPNLLAVHDLK